MINRRLPGAYVRTWAQFHFLPGARAGLRLLRGAGYLLVVVTNQRGIARGLMSEEALAAVHARMTAELARAGVALDAIYHCPHAADAGCGCRKPSPGMLRAAIGRFGIDPARSWVVGDSPSDIAAGAALGIPGVLVVPRGAPRPPGARTAGSLLATARLIVDGRWDRGR